MKYWTARACCKMLRLYSKLSREVWACWLFPHYRFVYSNRFLFRPTVDLQCSEISKISSKYYSRKIFQVQHPR